MRTATILFRIERRDSGGVRNSPLLYFTARNAAVSVTMANEHHTGSMTQEDALARHFRVRLSPPFRNAPQKNMFSPKLVLPNQMVIKTGEPERRLQTIRSCIYCGVTGMPLSEEHIVARGLDGTLILAEASCCECAKHTNERIEQLILNESLLAPRR